MTKLGKAESDDRDAEGSIGNPRSHHRSRPHLFQLRRLPVLRPSPPRNGGADGKESQAEAEEEKARSRG
jgi:hypothetical protein